MANPWNKRNPLLSMWLSGANAMWGAARSRAAAEAHRQSAAIVAESTRQIIRFWTGATSVPPRRRKRKSR